MDVDLNQYAAAVSDPETLRIRREALIDQLGWLSDEARALEPMLSELPAWAVDQAPLPGDLTVKQTLAHLSALDEDIYPKWIEQLVAEESPIMPEANVEEDPAANARDLVELLNAVRERRDALVTMIQAVPESEWTRKSTLAKDEVDLFDLALLVVRHDADCLRNLAYRLHEADLGGE